jgi:hypothetical protein
MPMSNFDIEGKRNRRRQAALLTSLVDEVPSEGQSISKLARFA